MSTRTACRVADRFSEHVGPSCPAGNGTRPASVRCVGVVLLAAVMGACSVSFPIGGLKSDAASTGSIERSAAMLSPALDHEDWRRARAALAVTLDPQGNGEPAAWRNPQSGAHGTFTADGSPFPDQDRVCRKFVGALVAGATSETRVAGSACRDGAGDWALRQQVDVRAS